VIRWDPAGWQQVDRFTADARRVLDLAFDRDGTRLATSGGEGVVKVWPTAPVSSAQICEALREHVTREDLDQALRAVLGAGATSHACPDLG
jgi:hypothetical protein